MAAGRDRCRPPAVSGGLVIQQAMLKEGRVRQTALGMAALGEPVPADHLPHKIDAVADFSLIHKVTALYYSNEASPLDR